MYIVTESGDFFSLTSIAYKLLRFTSVQLREDVIFPGGGGGEWGMTPYEWSAFSGPVLSGAFSSVEPVMM